LNSRPITSIPRSPRRPKSIQITVVAIPPRAPRHVSLAYYEFLTPAQKTPTCESEGGSKKKTEGFREFMNGVHLEHKRTKGTATVADDSLGPHLSSSSRHRRWPGHGRHGPPASVPVTLSRLTLTPAAASGSMTRFPSAPVLPRRPTSLWRATRTSVSVATGIVPKKNPLGHLRIFGRISQAHIELKRDLSVV
jgi:hypothetical protein